MLIHLMQVIVNEMPEVLGRALLQASSKPLRLRVVAHEL